MNSNEMTDLSLQTLGLDGSFSVTEGDAGCPHACRTEKKNGGQNILALEAVTFFFHRQYTCGV